MMTVRVWIEIGRRLWRLYHRWSSGLGLWTDRTPGAICRRAVRATKDCCMLAGAYRGEVEVTRKQAARRGMLVVGVFPKKESSLTTC